MAKSTHYLEVGQGVVAKAPVLWWVHRRDNPVPTVGKLCSRLLEGVRITYQRSTPWSLMLWSLCCSCAAAEKQLSLWSPGTEIQSTTLVINGTCLFLKYPMCFVWKWVFVKGKDVPYHSTSINFCIPEEIWSPGSAPARRGCVQPIVTDRPLQLCARWRSLFEIGASLPARWGLNQRQKSALHSKRFIIITPLHITRIE